MWSHLWATHAPWNTRNAFTTQRYESRHNWSHMMTHKQSVFIQLLLKILTELRHQKSRFTWFLSQFGCGILWRGWNWVGHWSLRSWGLRNNKIPLSRLITFTSQEPYVNSKTIGDQAQWSSSMLLVKASMGVKSTNGLVKCSSGHSENEWNPE